MVKQEKRYGKGDKNVAGTTHGNNRGTGAEGARSTAAGGGAGPGPLFTKKRPGCTAGGTAVFVRPSSH